MSSKKRIDRNQLRIWPGAQASPAPTAHRTEQPERSSAPRKWEGLRVHLVGIGGIGMSGIARLLRARGCAVTGCDSSQSQITEDLNKAEIPVTVGHSPSHVREGVDLVIISAAIRDTNPELREARKRGLTIVKYAQAVGWLMGERDGIAVAGSHGKTTTTSMIAYSLSNAGMNPSMLVGGLVPQMGGNARPGRRGPFVVEACEYDRSFLNLTPRAAVITNIDRDHLDYYSGGMDELIEAFGSFASQVSSDGVVVVNGDDPNALRAASRAKAEVQTFGEGSECEWRVGEWKRAEGVTRFRAYHKGRNIGLFDLIVPGLYNVRNALACIAICAFFEANRQDVREALAKFHGARRRFDRLGEADGVLVVDDYGHHPTEVKVTLDAAKQEYPKRRIWCVFQPHQCSRTRLLMDDFAGSFGAADRVIVPDIYSVRDSEADRRSVHARDLVSRLRNNGVEAEYGAEFDATINRLLTGVRRGDVVLTMGAGPVDHVARELLVGLQKRETADAVVRRA